VTDQFVVLGVARVRATWFRELSQWSTSAALPVDFVKCISLDEVRARLGSGRAFSALLIDAALPGLDRDLTDVAHATGCAVVAIDDGRNRRDWRELGVDAVLSEPAPRDTVLATLHEHARPVATFTTEVDLSTGPPASTGWRGQLVAVTGGGGVGTSTLAMAAAQGLAAEVRHGGLVLLADLARRGDLALLHDSGDIVPGVQELVEAYRARTLAPADLRALTFLCNDRGYHLLLGLRRPRDWSALPPRAFEAAIEGLMHTFRLTVTDVDADLEGEEDGGSIDVEERNVMARTSVSRADVVVVVGTASVGGLHRLTRVVHDILRIGVDSERLLVVVNRAPRAPRMRAEITAAIASSLTVLQGHAVPHASPLFIPERGRIEEAHRDAVPLPRQLVEPVSAAVAAVMDRVDQRGTDEPVAVTPGSLGSWSVSDL
jgi:hypothetical protein